MELFSSVPMGFAIAVPLLNPLTTQPGTRIFFCAPSGDSGMHATGCTQSSLDKELLQDRITTVSNILKQGAGKWTADVAAVAISRSHMETSWKTRLMTVLAEGGEFKACLKSYLLRLTPEGADVHATPDSAPVLPQKATSTSDLHAATSTSSRASHCCTRVPVECQSQSPDPSAGAAQLPEENSTDPPSTTVNTVIHDSRFLYDEGTETYSLDKAKWSQDATLQCQDCGHRFYARGFQHHANNAHSAAARQYMVLCWCSKCGRAAPVRYSKHEVNNKDCCCPRDTRILWDTVSSSVVCWFPPDKYQVQERMPQLREDECWLRAEINGQSVSAVVGIPKEVTLTNNNSIECPKCLQQLAVHQIAAHEICLLKMRYCVVCRQAKADLPPMHKTRGGGFCTGQMQVLQTYLEQSSVVPFCRYWERGPQ
eukprot:Polyplicarium_translucidae@DN2245_c0_g1_i3.p1